MPLEVPVLAPVGMESSRIVPRRVLNYNIDKAREQANILYRILAVTQCMYVANTGTLIVLC